MSKMVFRETKLDALKPGEFQIFAKTLSDTDAMLFAGISGEMSPLYLNESFAAETALKTRTVHPMLVAALCGGAIYRLLSPAVQTISREFHFLLPVYAGDTITACAEVREVYSGEGRVVLEISCYNQREEKVMEGTSSEVLMVPGQEA